jgi:hypothetical protein
VFTEAVDFLEETVAAALEEAAAVVFLEEVVALLATGEADDAAVEEAGVEDGVEVGAEALLVGSDGFASSPTVTGPCANAVKENTPMVKRRVNKITKVFFDCFMSDLSSQISHIGNHISFGESNCE